MFSYQTCSYAFIKQCWIMNSSCLDDRQRHVFQSAIVCFLSVPQRRVLTQVKWWVFNIVQCTSDPFLALKCSDTLSVGLVLLSLYLYSDMCTVADDIFGVLYCCILFRPYILSFDCLLKLYFCFYCPFFKAI